MQPEQRTAVLAAKLRVLVSEGWQRPASRLAPRPFPGGAALVDTADGAGWCFVAPAAQDRDPLEGTPDDLPPDRNPRGWLGGAIVWAARNEVTSLAVLLDDVTGHDARRAALVIGGPSVWRVRGRGVERVEPVPFVPVAAPDAVTELFGDVIREAGAEPVVDHGVLRAEVDGLEVGRVVTDDEGVPRLDVGVGKHDRLANSMLGHDRDVLVALRNAADAVRAHRRADAGAHPANRLVAARWLRSRVVADPTLAGLGGPLVPVEGTEPAGLKRPTPAIATGPGLVVACSVGADLDAVPFGADARAWLDPEAELVMVVPEPDALASVQLLVGRVPNTRLRTVPADWRG